MDFPVLILRTLGSKVTPLALLWPLRIGVTGEGSGLW